MNATKVQQIINQIIEENRTRIGAKAARKQYAAGKAQIAKLTELGIIDMMPAGYGFSDADAVIAAANEKATAVFNQGEGEAVAASDLYLALNEKDEAPKLRKGLKPNPTQQIKNGDRVYIDCLPFRFEGRTIFVNFPHAKDYEDHINIRVSDEITRFYGTVISGFVADSCVMVKWDDASFTWYQHEPHFGNPGGAEKVYAWDLVKAR